MANKIDPSWLRESAAFSRPVIREIQRAAREGIYDIRGGGAKRTVPTFDDLLFLMRQDAGHHLVDTQLACYGPCGHFVIARHQHEAGPQFFQFPDGFATGIVDPVGGHDGAEQALIERHQQRGLAGRSDGV